MNWAIVIGVDEYQWAPNARLKGAVNDALKVREWLLDPAGGNVPKDNLVLLLSPRPDADLQGVEHLDAKTDTILRAVNDVTTTLSGGVGERLYFFYAGHGLTARVSNRDEPALVSPEFNAVNTQHALALRSLWEYFETTQFADQFIFIDACRNMPWPEREIEIGRWTLPRKRDPNAQPVQQFILYATSPGLKATEEQEAGNEHGAFTAALLAGLRGQGPAKAWSWKRGGYEVRWNRLAEFVTKRLEEEKRAVASTPAGALLQIPQDVGARGVAGRDRDPVLVSFPAAGFANERLDLQLDPASLVSHATVVVRNEYEDVERRAPLQALPVTFELPPRTYTLQAETPDHRGRLDEPLELYQACERTIKLEPHGAPPASASAPAAPAAAPAAAESLSASAPDSLAIVEVLEDGGKSIDARPASVTLPVGPGFYRVRLRTPDGVADERLVGVAPGEHERVDLRLPAPSAPAAQLALELGGSLRDDNALTLAAEELGPMASVERTTLLALAAACALSGDALDCGAPLEGFGLSPIGEALRGADAGVVLLVSSGAPVRARLWPVGAPAPPDAPPLREVRSQIFELIGPCGPGSQWLSLERDGTQPIVFALGVPRGRAALVVVELAADRPRAFQYLPTIGAAVSSHPATVRKVEYLERLLLAGSLEGAEHLARELAASAAADPLAGCLAGYVLLRRGLGAELGPVAEAAAGAAPELADAHLLRAAATRDPGAAKEAVLAAADAGIPLFAEGLTRLLEGLQAGSVDHARAALVRHVFERHASGIMWSAFTPDSLTPGSLLVPAAESAGDSRVLATPT